MKAFAITHRGCEEFAAKEIAEKLKADCDSGDSVVTFDVKSEIDICRVCYTGQSIIKAGLLIKKGHTKDLEKIDVDFTQYLEENDSFRVTVVKNDIEKEKGEIEERLGEIIIDSIEKTKKYKQKVSLKNPDVNFLCFISEKEYYLGIDFAGIDLSKREYKIYLHPTSIKGTMAFSLIKFAGYTKKQELVNVMTGDGVIAIEAGLYATSYPIHFFQKDLLAFNKLPFLKKQDIKKMFENEDKKIDKTEKKIIGLDSSLRNVKSARKNSKIAGISKFIDFSKIDLDWLDIKMKKKSIDMIVAHLPSPSKNISASDIAKQYNELFYQAEYILKKTGTVSVVVMSNDLLLEAAKKYLFEQTHKKVVWAGEQRLDFLTFKNCGK